MLHLNFPKTSDFNPKRRIFRQEVSDKKKIPKSADSTKFRERAIVSLPFATTPNVV